jgi:hypothetical protein
MSNGEDEGMKNEARRRHSFVVLANAGTHLSRNPMDPLPARG